MITRIFRSFARIARGRRSAQFSLRTMLILLSALCVWLAWSVNEARRQREAIAELHRLHVAVLYRAPDLRRKEPSDVGWGERLLGTAFRESVDYVGFQHSDRLIDDPGGIEKALSLAGRLRGLKRLSLEGMPITDDSLRYLVPLVSLRKLNLMYTHVTEAGIAKLRKALPDCEIAR